MFGTGIDVPSPWFAGSSPDFGLVGLELCRRG